MSTWISVAKSLPPVSRKAGAADVAVLVWPPNYALDIGTTDGHAYYGRERCSSPAFHKFGHVLHQVQFWQPLPDGPDAAGSRWIPVDAQLPECAARAGALGVPVLIWPRNPDPELDGVDGQAYFGPRITGKPCFYKFGAKLAGVTHWMPLPGAPTGLR